MNGNKDSSTTPLEDLAKQHIDRIKGRLQETNLLDKERARERIRLKHLKRRVGKMAATTATHSSSVMRTVSLNQANDDEDVISSSGSSASVTSEDDYHVTKGMEDAVLHATS